MCTEVQSVELDAGVQPAQGVDVSNKKRGLVCFCHDIEVDFLQFASTRDKVTMPICADYSDIVCRCGSILPEPKALETSAGKGGEPDKGVETATVGCDAMPVVSEATLDVLNTTNDGLRNGSLPQRAAGAFGFLDSHKAVPDSEKERLGKALLPPISDEGNLFVVAKMLGEHLHLKLMGTPRDHKSPKWLVVLAVDWFKEYDCLASGWTIAHRKRATALAIMLAMPMSEDEAHMKSVAQSSQVRETQFWDKGGKAGLWSRFKDYWRQRGSPVKLESKPVALAVRKVDNPLSDALHNVAAAAVIIPAGVAAGALAIGAGATAPITAPIVAGAGALVAGGIMLHGALKDEGN
jgi:hypothetical protein